MNKQNEDNERKELKYDWEGLREKFCDHDILRNPPMMVTLPHRHNNSGLIKEVRDSNYYKNNQPENIGDYIKDV